MKSTASYIKALGLIIIYILLSHLCSAQNTIIYDIATEEASKQVLLFNTNLQVDSAPVFDKRGRKLTEDEAYVSEYPHDVSAYFTLFEADGSTLQIDTGGNFFLFDNENIDAKPKPLYINIDTLGIGGKNIIIETNSNDLENLKIYAIPYSQYRFGKSYGKIPSQISLRIEEIIYGAKNKVPPRILDLWYEQVKFIPENRKILYDFTIVLPQSMVTRNGERTLMIYDLSNQVVAIFPHLNNDVNVLRRDNIITNTYIYKLYFNEEEVKKGLIHFLSPEDEKKKLEEAEKKDNPPQEEPPANPD